LFKGTTICLLGDRVMYVFFLKKNCRPILFRKKYIDKQDGKMFREKLKKKC
jgi:hypothetical protein